ncbi:GDP-mannose 4,6-dehydratase [Dehalococcoidia bacterium]|nr:GDP-mannose 4,6-dehydratase [Dehalococcoidia bacterium]
MKREIKNILVTGVGGFIGSHFAEYYIAQGYNVIGVDNKSKDQISATKLFDYKQLMLPDDLVHSLIQKHKPDICIHCAGGSSVGFSVENPYKDFTSGALVTFHLLDCLRRFSPECKTIYPSSAAVYGNPASLPISENCPLNPISPYGYHKILCEAICNQFSNLYDLHIYILRIFSAYGPGLRKQIIWDIFNRIKKGKQLVLYGTGNESRDFVYIDDIIKAADIILNCSGNNYDVHNIASGQETSIRELAELIVRELNIDVPIVFSGVTKKGDPENWRADISKIRDLGFEPRIGLKEGILKLKDWFERVKDK